jgi:16S rRNA (guanine527-N7)-methyltransferase
MFDFKATIEEGCTRWGLTATPEALGRMEALCHMLLRRNTVMNLTAVTTSDGVARRHFLDCLFLLTLDAMRGKRIIDVGSGAGFPALALLCFDPELDVTALDATAKRVEFIREAAAAVGVPAKTLFGRAEELAACPPHREAYDVALSRAVAPMAELAELCLPLVRVGGFFYPQKILNAEGEAELHAARPAIERLGGEILSITPYDVPGLDITHQITVITKRAPTPPQFPRRWAKIKSKSL